MATTIGNKKALNTKSSLHRNQTSLAAEFYAAAELIRRNFVVSVTFGNTKAIDLLAERAGKLYALQVKGIQSKESISFNLSRTSIRKGTFYVFVNINAVSLSTPEFFILTSEEVVGHLKLAKSGRDWIDYNYLKKNGFGDRWNVIN